MLENRLVVALGASALGLLSLYVCRRCWRAAAGAELGNGDDLTTYEQLVGNTPLVELKKASALLGCRILVKMESMNPGGTGKDRASMYMLREARATGLLKPGGCVYEGTSGSTGISLASLCSAKGYRLKIVMPDDQSLEKRQLLERMGAELIIVPSCAISNPQHYVNVAKTLAKKEGGFFTNQFENTANFKAHLECTGPEIWRQTAGKVDAFVMSAGTGGTIAGVSKFLKSRNPEIKVILADPNGSSLFHRVKFGVCYTPHQSEKSIKKHRYDSIVEGVGLDRLTNNFALANVDSAMKISDQEILETAHWLLKNEGLFVGSSSALNVAVACRQAAALGPGHTVVTMICDNGQRHMSRLWNPDYVGNYGLTWPVDSDAAEDKVPWAEALSPTCM